MPAGTTVCDVGAGVGAISIKLARAHPHLKITLQDISSLEQAKKVGYEGLNPSHDPNCTLVALGIRIS